MSTKNEKLLHSLKVDEKLDFAEKLIFSYANTDPDKNAATKAIYDEAQKKNSHAEFLMYKLNMKDNNAATAMLWLKRAYDQKYPKALAFTYFEYLNGNASFINYDSARANLFSALQQEIPEAYFFVSYALDNLAFMTLPHKFEALWQSLYRSIPELSNNNPGLDQTAKLQTLYNYHNNTENFHYESEYNEEECTYICNEFMEKATSLGFSFDKVIFDKHQFSNWDAALLSVETCILFEAFNNTRNLIYHIESHSIHSYLNNLCNQHFLDYTTSNSFKINLKVLTLNNQENRYFLYIEALEINHKFYYNNPKYFLIILDKYDNNYVYAFSGRYNIYFSYDLTQVSDVSEFYIKGYSNDKNFLISKAISKFNPKRVTGLPYQYEIKDVSYPIGILNNTQAVNFFTENALEMYRLTKKGLKRFFNL